MKTIQCLVLFLLLPTFNFAQAPCSANAGGDQYLCQVSQFNLFGESTGDAHPSGAVMWSLDSIPAGIDVTITPTDQPNAVVTPNAPHTQFINGEYIFEFCILCNGDPGNPPIYSCDLVKITVKDLDSQASILPHNDPVCGDEIVLTGSSPGSGIINNWSVDPSFDIIIEDLGDQLKLTNTGNTVCSYEVTYTHELGSCISTTTTEVNFVGENPDVSIKAIPGCPSCTLNTELQATGVFGCENEAVWECISGDCGGVVITTPHPANAFVSVPEPGVYTFRYTMTSDYCPPNIAEITCEFFDLESFELGPDEEFIFCEDTWDVGELNFSVPHEPGATYNWVFSSNVGIDHHFDPTNTSSTTLYFNNLPIQVLPPPSGLSMIITVTASLNGCTDEKKFKIIGIPDLEISEPVVPLLCGGQPNFLFANYITAPFKGFTTIDVISAPAGALTLSPYFLSPSTTANLSVPGTYEFLVTSQATGTNPATGQSVTCKDSESFTVVIAEFPSINAGADAIICKTSIELNGNTPLDSDGEPLPIPVSWSQISGPTGANIENEDQENTLVTGLEYGNTYVFQYTFSNTTTCIIQDEVVITVKPEEDCDGCEMSIGILEECVDGCTSVMVTGADSYLWSPTSGVSDAMSDSPTICNSAGGVYTVIGYDANGEECGTAEIEIEPCAPPPVECDGFYGEASCATCGCGNEYGGATIYTASGVIADPSIYTITWTVYGNTYVGNPMLKPYLGPTIFVAHIYYVSPDGQVCEETVEVEVVCLEDCGSFSVGVCSEDALTGGDCGGAAEEAVCNGEGSLLYVLDGAGNPVNNNDYNIDWYNDGTSEGNPLVLPPSFNCESIEVRVWTWAGCEEIFTYELDCCSSQTIEVSCGGSGEEGVDIYWDAVCGSEGYDVIIMCVDEYNYGSTDYIYVPASGPGSYYTATIPVNEECSEFAVQVNGYCSSTGDYGPGSNCLYVSSTFCFEDEENCEYYWGFDGFWREKNEQVLVSSQDFQIYPNPTSNNEVFLNINEAMIRSAKGGHLKIADNKGALQIMQPLIWGTTDYQIDIEKLPAGIYFFSLVSQDNVMLETKRFVKTH